MRPRFQFTIRNLLWATFWVSVALLPWALAIQSIRRERPPDEIMALAVVGGIYAPFLAVGALFGRTLLALKIAVFTVGMSIVLGGFVALIVNMTRH